MSSSSSPWESWFRFLTTDAQVVGVVGWLGLVVTLAGFGIALAQIRKIKRSSEAANDAVKKLVKVVRSHEQSARIAAAFGYLTSAQTMMKQANMEAAAAYLSVGWTALLTARELSGAERERLFIEGIVVATRELLDDISTPTRKPSSSASLVVRRNADIARILNDLGTFSVRLNSALSGIGSAS